MSSHRRQQRREESSTASNGLNLNNMDLSSIAALVNNVDINQLSAIFKSLNQAQEKSNGEQNQQNSSEANQRRSEIVRALNTLMNADKTELLQIVLQLYGPNKTAGK